MEAHPSVPERTERAASKRPSITYVAEQSAIHVRGVHEVSFMLESLRSWALNYHATVAEDLIVPDARKQDGSTEPVGAYVYDEATLEEALRHRFNVSYTEDRMTASRLLAQLATAAVAHQKHLDQIDAYAEGELHPAAGSPRR